MQVYGGDFPWVGVKYELNVITSFSPLQLLNKLSSKLLFPRVMVLDRDGSFRHPEDNTPLFPIGGMDLRWRWDSTQKRMVIDFLSDGNVLPWRWDECKPGEDLRWPSLAPDWECIGHVGNATFEYKLAAAVYDTYDSTDDVRQFFIGDSVAGSIVEDSPDAGSDIRPREVPGALQSGVAAHERQCVDHSSPVDRPVAV